MVGSTLDYTMYLLDPYLLFSKGFTKAIFHSCMKTSSANDRLTNFIKVGSSSSKTSLSKLVGMTSKSQHFDGITLIICITSSIRDLNFTSLCGELSL